MVGLAHVIRPGCESKTDIPATSVGISARPGQLTDAMTQLLYIHTGLLEPACLKRTGLCSTEEMSRGHHQQEDGQPPRTGHHHDDASLRTDMPVSVPLRIRELQQMHRSQSSAGLALCRTSRRVPGDQGLLPWCRHAHQSPLPSVPFCKCLRPCSHVNRKPTCEFVSCLSLRSVHVKACAGLGCAPARQFAASRRCQETDLLADCWPISPVQA